MYLLNTSQGLSDIIGFFNNYAGSGDVDGALVSTSFLFKAVLWLIIFVGAVAMAIWIARIAIDILLLATRGTKIADSKLKDFGTGKDGAAKDVKEYISKNGIEILLMIVLFTFLITGWLFRLVAVALAGFGALGNKLFDLDIAASFSNTEVQSYVEQIPARRATALRAEYDELIGNIRAESKRLYDYAAKGVLKTEQQYQKSSNLYTHYIYRAQAISQQMTTEEVQALNLKTEYFNQHLSVKGDQICNDNFIDSTVSALYTGASVDPLSCGATTEIE